MISIIRSDGTATTAMQLPSVQVYLENVLNDKSRSANLKQALNDVGLNRGKASGALRFRTHPVLHASSGKQGTPKCVTLFFIRANGTAQILAMGRHADPKRPIYEIDGFGQNGDPTFAKGRKVHL